MATDELVLVTGATGYIGRFLVPLLLDKGYQVRVLVRDPSRLENLEWSGQVQVVEGDTLSPETLVRAMQGVTTAYYLIHNMSSGRHYLERESDSARNFSSSACDAGVGHIIYLGGLANPREKIGKHLRSRIETGITLQQGCTPVTEFRASLIIGSGSISFEMIRYLTEQLPVIVGPAWLRNLVQPIAVDNVLDYLVAALEKRPNRARVYEIGGEDVITYLDTLSTYAQLRGLKRTFLTLPYFPLKLMSYFASKLAPIPETITLPLIEGMRTQSLVEERSAIQDFPGITLLDYKSAVDQALSRLEPSYFEFMWKNGEGSFRMTREGFHIEVQRVEFSADAKTVYKTLLSMGGRNGWLYMNALWKIRGFIDRLLGGPGMRGRSSDVHLAEGDPVDFYSVETLRPGRMMRLKSELKAPGSGWMEWRIHPRSKGRVELEQIAYFVPRGLPGFLYWNLLRPIHVMVFKGLIKAIARQSVLVQRQSEEIEIQPQE